MEEWKMELTRRIGYCELFLRYDWQWSCSLPLSWHNVQQIASMKANAYDVKT